MSVVIMVGSIKLFLKLCNVYKAIGIYPCQSNQGFFLEIKNYFGDYYSHLFYRRFFSFNVQNLVILFCLAQMLISVTAYSYVHAKSIGEYGIVFFAGITLLNAINYVCLQIRNGPNIFQLIEHLERFIEMRELQNYWQISENLFTWHHILHRIKTPMDIFNFVLRIKCKNWKNLWNFVHCAGKMFICWSCNTTTCSYTWRLCRALSFR